MSLKDNFNQALKDLLKKDGLVGEDLSKDSKAKADPDKYSDRQSKSEARLNKTESNISDSQNKDEYQNIASDNNSQQNSVNKDMAFSSDTVQSDSHSKDSDFIFTPPPVTNKSSQASASSRIPDYKTPDSTYYDTEETTIISRNTIIDGNIRSFANITIDGSVKGDVSITKNINVTGKVVGNIECNNSTMVGASMQGNILSKGQIQMDKDSLLLGDISSQYLDLNGKIKGNIEVGGKAEFKTDAVILGNITASTITVLDGATIQGYVNTTFLQENTNTMFPESIAVAE